MKRIISILTFAILLIAIFLMTLPGGVRMSWADLAGIYTYYYSYFDLTVPFASGNWLPLLTAVLVIAAVIITLLQIIKPDISDKWNRRLRNSLITAIVCSLASFVLFATATARSGIITLLISLPLALQYYLARKQAEEWRRRTD